MNDVSDDALWRILKRLSTFEMCAAREVSHHIRRVVDSVPQLEWKRIYHERVWDSLIVGDDFDWRRATCLAGRAVGIQALCLWNYKSAYLEIPWLDEEHLALETPLRHGVRRNVIDLTTIEFVYDNTFRLRGMARTCLRRNAINMCLNCRLGSKQRCLNLKYQYYVREMPRFSANEHSFNECLGLRLAAHP